MRYKVKEALKIIVSKFFYLFFYFAELFFNSKFGLYLNDSYNYEESSINSDTKVHFYNIGGSYAKGASRISLNYGRQRGGLLCVGGICRQVSPNTGLTLNLTTSF